MSDRMNNVTSCIDMDQWKHSWHNPMNSVEDLRQARGIISEKIGETIDRLSRLQSGMADVNILIEDKITSDVDQMKTDIQCLIANEDETTIEEIKADYK
jgi:hypothetical protein